MGRVASMLRRGRLAPGPDRHRGMRVVGALVGGVVLALPMAAGAATVHRTGAPRLAPQIAQFLASPSQLSSSGGVVSLIGTVRYASSCELRAEEGSFKLPAATDCSSGLRAAQVRIPANDSTAVKTFHFDLAARGHGSTRAARATVRVSGREGRSVAPSITTEPSSVTVSSGDAATFGASASGTPSPTVHWQFSYDSGQHWFDLLDANSPTLTLTATSVLNGDFYRAVFTNRAGSTVTSAAELTVTTDTTAPSSTPAPTPPSTPTPSTSTTALSAPSITAEPSSSPEYAGASVTLTAAASGDPVPSVQWYAAAPGTSSYSAIAGATSTTYSFVASLAENGETIEAVFTNSQGAATTAPVTLDVVAPSAPAVTENPSLPKAVSACAPVTVSAAATGDPSPTVQWYTQAPGASAVAIPGATSTTFSFVASAADNGVSLEATFTNLAGSVTTSSATLTVDDLLTYNWSGYALCGTTFSEVGAEWTVPSVTCPASASPYQPYSLSQWVGIDGLSDPDVEQLGVESDCTGGTAATPSPWIEMVGDTSVNDQYELPLYYACDVAAVTDTTCLSNSDVVSPGDLVSASATYLPGSGAAFGSWEFVFSDETAGWSWSGSVSDSSSFEPARTSAEWVVERPEYDGSFTDLADYGTASFSDMSVNGSVLALGSVQIGGSASLSEIDMVDHSGDALSDAQTLGQVGTDTGFATDWEDYS